MKLTRCLLSLFILLPCMTLCGEEVSVAQSVQIYDRYGSPMRGFLSGRQTYYRPVSLNDISPWLVLAAVSLEDKRFFTHPGVDAKAALRALWQNASAGEVVSGASTITQQLVRALDPQPKTLWGKAKEAAKAVALEREKSKEEILEAYFNRLEFGNLTQGAEAAANFYFNASAKNLSLSQAAFLAGIIKSPTKYNPLKRFDRALARRNRVLKSMLDNGFVSPEVYRLALNEKIELEEAGRPFSAPHFTRFLRGQIASDAQDVQSTLDGKLQTYAEEIIKTYISKLADEHVTQAAAVVIDNASGAVLAYVGSADFDDTEHGGQIDGLRALRQPGSALKPFVYALAMEKGLSAGDLLEDKDTFFEGGFRPRNYDETFHGKVSARAALACSYNIPAVLAAQKAGAANVLGLLRELGLTSLSKDPDFYGLGIALGSGEVRLLDLANAYAALARGGVYKPLLFATEPLVTGAGRERRILPENVSYIVTDILADNDARSAAFGLNSPLRLPFDLAAKTGTSKDYRDNFTIAFTPRWTIGVWAGNFDATPMQKVSGVSGAAPIMHDLALYMQERYPSPGFKRPDGVESAVICTQSGLLAARDCAHTKEELYVTGRTPQKRCDGRHGSDPGEALKIVFPQNGDVFKIDPSAAAASQELKFRTNAAEETACTWLLNGQKLPQNAPELWWRLVPGKYTLKAMCGGKEAQIRFEVLE